MPDMRIVNGLVFDARNKCFCRADLGVKNGRLCAAEELENTPSLTVVDASSCFVLPGLVDHHAHLFYGGSELGVHEELACLPFGVTTCVDAGTVGTSAMQAFAQRAEASPVRLKVQINIASGGITSFKYAEDVSPVLFDDERFAETLERYGRHITGIKLRMGRGKGVNSSMAALEAALGTAQRYGLPLIVHVTEPAAPLADIAAALRAGDTFSHVHQGLGESILDEHGDVRSCFVEAQARGVLFDAAKGVRNCSFRVARRALECGFLPDIISSDVTSRSIYKPTVFALPFVLSAYMALGLSLEQVIHAATAAPARALGLEDEIGSLEYGRCADIALFRMAEGHFTCVDGLGEALSMDRCLVPCMTIRGGRVMYRALDFC